MDTPIADPQGLVAQLRAAMPIRLEPLTVGGQKTGLVIVDEVNGFATVGAGYLAPPAENPQVTRMVAETDRLARAFSQGGRPILAFLDTHVPGKPEPPYPPHCEAGTGEENLVPKLAWLEQDKHTTLVRKDCIIATNTSSISIDLLAEAVERKENFLGMHFFNPVHRMPLVEVIYGAGTSKEAIATVVAYASAMGKTPIVVKNCPGFLVNRVLFPYFGGFAKLVSAGVDFVRIDKIMEKFGWPMGPAYLMDVVGNGIVKIPVKQTYALKDAAQAHIDLEARKTTGSTVLIP